MNNSTSNTPHDPSELNGHDATSGLGSLNDQSAIVKNGAINGNAALPDLAAANGALSQQGTAASSDRAPATQPGWARRLAAQFLAARQAQRGEAWEHDPLTRPRDKHENPQQRDIVHFAVAPGDELAVKDTPKAELLNLIAQTYPLRAKSLHDFYDHSVRPLLKRYQDKGREEWEKLAGINAEIERHNVALEARRAELEMERDEKTRADREAILALDGPLREAHQQAGHTVALTGGSYDPHNPVPESVLRQAMRALEAIAGEIGIPWTPGDATRRSPKWFLWVLTTGIGVVVGLSLAILGTFLDADALGDQWQVAIGAALVGFIVAACGGLAVKHFCRAASERYYLAIYGGRGPLYWMPSLLAAIGVCCIVIGMDAAIEFGGLLKAANLDMATGAGAKSIPLGLAYLVGMVITFGYILTYAREGALDGRYHPCLNRLKALQECEFVARDEEIRDRATVQEALDAIAAVRDLQREKGMMESRVEMTSGPFDTEIAALEGLKRVPQHELSLDARRSIQDAHDNWIGAHAQYAGRVEAIVAAIEPVDSSGNRASRKGVPQEGGLPGASPQAVSPLDAAAPQPRTGFLHWLRRRFGARSDRSGLQGRCARKIQHQTALRNCAVLTSHSCPDGP